PSWLVGEAAAGGEGGGGGRPWENRMEWSRRKLLIFAGHVPKLYISSLRYHLWRQLRELPSATVVSSTLACTVGSFSVCRRSMSFLSAQNNTFFSSHCHRYCGARLNIIAVNNETDATAAGEYRCGSSSRRLPSENLRHLLRQCRAYRAVNFSSELPAIVRDTRLMKHPDYLHLAMSHKFCLVAPGDFISTHKTTEVVAIGGAGGCIPLIVLPGRHKVASQQVS
ncbi:MAG: hypothetical protein SGPRY_006017, partial [Prymnesium sp.]